MSHPIFTEEHALIRDQLRRFVDEQVRPNGPKWEEAGFVPREVLRQMGELGFFSLRVPEALGGAGLDARASVVLAEEVGRSTHGGFAITVLVHTDMASPHLVRFGTKRAAREVPARRDGGKDASPPSASPSPAPAPTWRASAPARCATAITMC